MSHYCFKNRYLICSQSSQFIQSYWINQYISPQFQI